MAAADYFDSVQKIYIAFYSRPADPVGRDYWADVLNTNGGNLSTMIDSFATSSEATALYAGQGTNAKINAIYNALFGRDGDVAGITFYANEIAAGTMTIGAVGINILNGAQAGVDLDAVNSKVTYSTSFTAAIDTAAELVGYEGTTAAASARTELATVTDAATLTTATANIDATLTTIAENPPGVAGSTFTLATTADTLNPTATGTSQTSSGDDTITGAQGRLGSDDSIDGGGGNDILNITVATGAAPIIQNVETINLTTRGNATALDFTDITGVTHLNVSGTQSATIGGLAATATLSVQSGFANNLALSLSDATGTADAVTVVADGASAFTLNLSGIETLNLQAAGDVVFGNSSNASQINLSGAGLNISGTGDVTLYFGTAGSMNTGASALSAINATALQGDLSVTLFALNKVTINAGTGNDTFNFGSGGLDTLDSINGGAGSDTVRNVVVNGASTVRPTLTNVETLTFDGYATAATVDLRNATALTDINLKATAAVTLTKLNNTVTAINIYSAAGAPAMGFDYSNSGPVSVHLGTTGTAAAGITIDDISVGTNTGSLTLVSEGVSANVMADLSANVSDSITLTVNKTLAMDDIIAAAANSVTINAVADLDMSALSAADADVVSVNLSSGADLSALTFEIAGASSLSLVSTETGNIVIDTIIMGTGMDTITINAQGDVTIDTLSFSAAGATSTNAVTIDVTIGSGATADIQNISPSTAASAAHTLTFTLTGSGNVSLQSAASGILGPVASASIDSISLGGNLSASFSASTGIKFSVSLGNGSGNTISLGAQADTVIGGATADIIQGGGGADELIGGGGADVFVYISDMLTAGGAASAADGVDVITDMSTADVLQLTNVSAGTLITAASYTALGLTATIGTTAQVAGNYAVFQRGSDVVVQVYLSTGIAITAVSAYLEIIMQGETMNTAFAATFSVSALSLTNLVIS